MNGRSKGKRASVGSIFPLPPPRTLLLFKRLDCRQFNLTPSSLLPPPPGKRTIIVMSEPLPAQTLVTPPPNPSLKGRLISPLHSAISPAGNPGSTWTPSSSVSPQKIPASDPSASSGQFFLLALSSGRATPDLPSRFSRHAFSAPSRQPLPSW